MPMFSGSGVMSTNFSPNNVFGRTVSSAAFGILSDRLMSMAMTASLPAKETFWTRPTLTPRILTSEPFCSPCPAESNVALNR
jgi:hypothetical protein